MRTHLIILISFLAVARAPAAVELKGTPDELAQHLKNLPQMVSVTGESELKVPADRALIYLKVVTENKSLQEALRVNQEIRGKILNILRERGLPAERVQPSKFSSTPKYGMFSEKAKSYRVENVVKISAQDEKEFQAVAGLVDTMPEVRYDSIEFEHSDKDALKAKVLAQAIDKAVEREKLYEEKLGLRLSPRSFVEGGISQRVPRPSFQGGTAPSSIGGSPARAVGFDSTSSAYSISAEETPTSFGELIYKAQVTIEYSVENK